MSFRFVVSKLHLPQQQNSLKIYKNLLLIGYLIVGKIAATSEGSIIRLCGLEYIPRSVVIIMEHRLKSRKRCTAELGYLPSVTGAPPSAQNHISKDDVIPKYPKRKSTGIERSCWEFFVGHTFTDHATDLIITSGEHKKEPLSIKSDGRVDCYTELLLSHFCHNVIKHYNAGNEL